MMKLSVVAKGLVANVDWAESRRKRIGGELL